MIHWCDQYTGDWFYITFAYVCVSVITVACLCGMHQNETGDEVAYSKSQTSTDWLASHSVKAMRLSLKDLVNKGTLLRCDSIGDIISCSFTKTHDKCDKIIIAWHCFLQPGPSPPLDNIRVMVIVWRLRGNIIRTALHWIVWHNVHCLQHIYVSSSYR